MIVSMAKSQISILKDGKGINSYKSEIGHQKEIKQLEYLTDHKQPEICPCLPVSEK